MYRKNCKLPLAIFLLLFMPACFADRDEPMHLEADQVIMNDAQQISTFIGNVRLSQGTLLIQGDKIVVVQDKDGFKYATAYGNTAEFRQRRDGLNEYVEGYGERIEYDARNQILNLYEKARFKRDRDEVSGDHITYNAKTEIFQVSGSAAGSKNNPSQRVRAVLQPKSKESMTSPSPSGALSVTSGVTSTPSQ